MNPLGQITFLLVMGLILLGVLIFLFIYASHIAQWFLSDRTERDKMDEGGYLISTENRWERDYRNGGWKRRELHFWR